ncbi:CPBP family intramembrane glutamic endopeptidase [Dictyobacter halimunensis]
MSEQIITRQSRPFSLVVYLLIVFGLSWPFQIASVVWGGENFALVYALNCTAMIMVTVGTYIAGRYVFRDGFAGSGWSWGWPRYYLAVIGLALLLWVVPTCVDLALKTLKLPAYITPMQIMWVFVLLFGTLIPGFGEEFGWRGYMLPRLAQRMSARRAVLQHSVIWWFWHLPILVGNAVVVSLDSMKSSTGISIALTVLMIILLSAIPTILHGVVFAYIWTRYRSLAVSSVYHASYDGLRDSLTLTIGLGPVASLWANLVLIVLGIVLLWKGNWTSLTVGAASTEVPVPAEVA